MNVQLAEKWWFEKDNRDGCGIMDGDWIPDIARRLTEIAERMPQCEDRLKLADEVEYIIEHFHFGPRAKELCMACLKGWRINERLKKLKKEAKK